MRHSGMKIQNVPIILKQQFSTDVNKGPFKILEVNIQVAATL
jgi:hypothetical protein